MGSCCHQETSTLTLATASIQVLVGPLTLQGAGGGRGRGRWRVSWWSWTCSTRASIEVQCLSGTTVTSLQLAHAVAHVEIKVRAPRTVEIDVSAQALADVAVKPFLWWACLFSWTRAPALARWRDCHLEQSFTFGIVAGTFLFWHWLFRSCVHPILLVTELIIVVVVVVVVVGASSSVALATSTESTLAPALITSAPEIKIFSLPPAAITAPTLCSVLSIVKL